jgi:hypothetical protein
VSSVAAMNLHGRTTSAPRAGLGDHCSEWGERPGGLVDGGDELLGLEG